MSGRTQVLEKPKPSRPSMPPASGLTAPLSLQRKCACGGTTTRSGSECQECKKKKLQRRSATASGPLSAPPLVHDVLNSPGQPLDANTRSFMEPRFGHDFSRVRVHADGRAAESARAVNALAYAFGRHIVFDAGMYSPHNSKGRQLLAHELAHVAQQSRAAHEPVPDSISVGSQTDSLEAAADNTAAQVLHSGPVPAHAPGPAVSRGLVQRQAATPAPTADFRGCHPGLQNDLRAKQPVALGHVDRAITALAPGWNRMAPADQASFRTYFDPAGSGEIDDGFVRDVRGNYQTIRSYMSSLTFDCNPASWSLCGTSRSLCRPDGNLMWTCFGAVHVCPGPYRTATDDFKVETMIHESTHNALHTTDREYSRSANFSRLRPRGGLGWRILRNIPIFGYFFRLIRASNDTLYNPDSYSGFAMQV